ncbi:hypothetical protein EFD56_14845 [Rhizobium phaseoli]|uniref:hypothetical protein n=1 Tax=Rhizobium phaseoli TaxID=396 RepID=UPI000F884560|nr:hypothetical protein [Rhizobium phaseoli]RUM18725.1 hypothetical protein EFD56_14845 [Rhizobium phaseoli]
MKYSFCAAAFGVASLILSANTTIAEEDICKSAGEAARAVMTQRQRDVDMSVMMEVVDKQQEIDELKKAFRQLIIAAYERPAFSTEAMQAKEIAEFVNVIQLACYKRVK